MANKEITELKNRLDKANADRTERENEAIRDLDDAKNQLKYFMQSRDDWRSRAKHAEKEVEDLKKDNEWLKRSRIEWAKKVAERDRQIKELKATLEKANADRAELQKDRDSYCGLYTELRKDYDKLFEDNRKLKARTDCHRYEVEWYRKHYKEKSEKIGELKSRLNSIYGVNFYDQGQNELWEMLQLVKDMQPNEFDTECECLGDVIDMDLEDFKEAYDKWEEEQKKVAEEAKKQHTEHMRDYLKKFCVGKLCFGCPLYNASEPVSSCLFSKLTDEEVEKRYKKAVETERSKKTPTPMSARLPQPWECTIEAKFEINEAVPNTICGTIKDDKKQ